MYNNIYQPTGELSSFEALLRKTGLISWILLPATSLDISWALGRRPQNSVSAPSQLYNTILCFEDGLSGCKTLPKN